MASIQIPNLTAAISVSGAEQMEAVQGGSSVRVTIQQIADLAGSQYGLQPIPDNTILGNLSGVSALPTDYTLSQFLDYYSTTQGAVLYRGQSSWQALAPGLNGQVLRTNGTGADVSWYTVPGGGTVQSITAGTNLSVSGSANPITLAGTINTVMNPAFTTSVTTPSIYGGSSASQTLLIQSTTGVGTSDSIVFKVGNNGAITAMTIASDGTVTIPQAAIDTTSITVPLLIGGTTASSTLTLESTSGAGTSDAIIFKTGSQTERMRIRSDGGVGIGGTGNSSVGLYLQKNITGATTSYGIYSNGTVQNDVTLTTLNIATQSNIASGTVLTNYVHYRTTEGTISGSMTNQFGFDSGPDLISASNNYAFRAQNTAAVTAGKTAYGFYSAVNTATGGGTTYGFYAAGTAANVMPNLNGGISASSSLTLQSTTGVGTTDSILFKVGNNGATTAMTINTSGQVGIGTTSPAAKLDVRGSSTFLVNATNPTAWVSVDSALTTGSMYNQWNTTSNVGISGTYTNHAYTFVTNNTERMRIDSSGRVGIGIAATSTAKLQVKSALDQNLIVGPSVSLANSVSLSATNDAASANIPLEIRYATQTTFYDGGTPRLTIDSTGDVGINTTTPAYLLDVVPPSATATNGAIVGNTSRAAGVGTDYRNGWFLRRRDNTNPTSYGIWTSSDTTGANYWENMILGAQGGGASIVFQTGSASLSEAMRINNSGNVGIGVTSLTYGLEVGGTTAAKSSIRIQNGTAGSSFLLQSDTSGIAYVQQQANAPLVFATNNLERMRIDSSGNVSIGPSGTSAVGNFLTNANITGGTTAYAHWNTGVVQSGVTATAYSFSSAISLAAAAFTTSNLVHFIADPNTGGAGSTITNQTGFYAQSSLGTQGGATVTNAYGFYGNIASGTNRWNLYMGGTANNYMAGRLGLNSTALTSVAVRNNLTITGAITAYGNYTEGGIASDVTSNAYVYASAASLNSASTTAVVAHYYVNPAAGVAGSTITNHYGLLINDNLRNQGAATVTFAAGVYSNLVAATNAYNLYTNGTANNYFAGYSFGLGGVQNSTTATATNTATLTATQVASGFIVGTPTATASYTLPTAAALDTELSNSPTGTNFELIVFTTAAFAITILTATGWTLVGSMATGATANSFARFRARKTGAGAWSLYRVS